MVRPLEPMVISRRDITEKLSILTLTITSSNNNITASTTTLTTLTPRSISTTGTGLTSTLTTATDTQYPANQDRDSSLTTRRTETCPVFLILTLVMIFLMNCNDSSLSTELPTPGSLCRVTTPRRATLLLTDGSSERSSCNGGILSRTSSNCDLSRVHP